MIADECPFIPRKVKTRPALKSPPWCPAVFYSFSHIDQSSQTFSLYPPDTPLLHFTILTFLSHRTSGKRYYDEALTAPYDAGKYTREQEDNTGYIILDSTSEFFNGTDLWYHEGLKDKDETLYDYVIRKGWAVKAARGEIEDELAALPEYMIPVEEGPFYAVTTHAFRIESYVSLKTADSSTQIVNSAGEPIGNLYGAGTLVVSNVIMIIISIMTVVSPPVLPWGMWQAKNQKPL